MNEIKLDKEKEITIFSPKTGACLNFSISENGHITVKHQNLEVMVPKDGGMIVTNESFYASDV